MFKVYLPAAGHRNKSLKVQRGFLCQSAFPFYSTNVLQIYQPLGAGVHKDIQSSRISEPGFPALSRSLCLLLQINFRTDCFEIAFAKIQSLICSLDRLFTCMQPRPYANLIEDQQDYKLTTNRKQKHLLPDFGFFLFLCRHQSEFKSSEIFKSKT